MRVLCVAEKPSIAKSISDILSNGQRTTRRSQAQYNNNHDFSYRLSPPLGPPSGWADFTVTSVLGHLTTSDFGEGHRAWQSCDPFQLFDAPIRTIVPENMLKVADNLRKEARTADLLMIWTDCDREGEHIGQEIANVCRQAKRNIIVKRAKFSAIIPAQIHRACQNPVELDVRQADAVEARISLDLRLGAAFTRFQTLQLQSRVPELAENVISYGPCQYPTLGFVCDQHFRVQNFVPERFWYIYLALERDESTVKFTWSRNHLFDFAMAVALYEMCVESPVARVTSVKTKPTQKWKPLPLTTVELQKTGSRLLRLAPKRVLDVAEKLYQQGFLSYPRTETDQFDSEFDFNSLIRKQTADSRWGDFSQRLLDGAFQRPRNGSKNDKAHPPIHPTAHAGNLEGDEKRVYELVTRRFLACCSTNAQGKSTTIEIDLAGEFFSTSGLVVLEKNYLEVYIYDKWADSYLPDFQQGETFTPSVCELKDGQTASPAYLTEADLVGLMDKNGIGTDATIAEHIAKIIERAYVEPRQSGGQKYLVPSDLGIGLVEGYNRIGFDRSLTKPHLRRETEDRMQMICDGVVSKREVIDESIYQYQEVYVRARQQFNTVVESVTRYMEEQPTRQIRAARPARRGGGGMDGGGSQDESDDPGDDDGGGGGGGGGRGGSTRGRGRPRGRGRGGAASNSTTTKTRRGSSTTATTRGARGGKSKTRTANQRDDQDDDGDDQANIAPPPPSRTKRPRPAATTTAMDEEPGEAPICKCDQPAIELTVKREGPNKGRGFWTCAKGQDQGCGFFEWALGGTTAPRRPVSHQAITHPPPEPRAHPHHTATNHGGVSTDQGPLCDCASSPPTPAIRRQVQKAGPNQGRHFWTCVKPQGEQCGFFEWDGEGQEGETGGSGGGGGGGGNAGGGGSSGECFKCGQEGHWASACPNEDSSGQNRRGSGGRRGGTGSDSKRGGARGGRGGTGGRRAKGR